VFFFFNSFFFFDCFVKAHFEMIGFDSFMMASELIKEDMPRIRVPLACVIHYRGYTVSAASISPITRNTLVYGTSNDILFCF